MNKKIIYIVLLIIMVLIVTFGVFFYNKYRIKKNTDIISNNVDNVSSTEENKPIELMSLPAEPAEIPEWYKTDKDGDGLTDDEEDKLGTNKWESDSDGDDISDKLEIEKYHTNPLNPDTDGDGFRDGVEILGGFDPLKK